MKVNIITLENKQDYIILSTIEHNNNRYFVLINEDNDNDLCIRKVVLNTENKETLVKLDSKEEFIAVLNIFNKLNRKENNE